MRKVVTEDLGKIAEKALCNVVGTTYNMKFKYSHERVDTLTARFASLAQEFAGYTHTGHNDNLNDFTSEDKSTHLSVKTTKKGSKICPQVIGQPSRSTFCPYFGLPPDASNDQIKSYIETHPQEMVMKYMATTFHCTLLFYCEKTNLCQLINMISPPPWSEVSFSFSHKEKNSAWNESSTLYIQRVGQPKITLGEFQVHNHRNCIKFRFELKNLLTFFPSCFTIRDVPV